MSGIRQRRNTKNIRQQQMSTNQPMVSTTFRYFILISFLLIVSSLSAAVVQDSKIVGYVTNEQNEPLSIKISKSK